MKNNNLGSVKQIDWTNEQIAFFWDWKALNHNDYFTETAGLGILERAKSLFPRQTADVLDFGSGPGFLTRLLVESFDKVYALDNSEASLEVLRDSIPNLMGAFNFRDSSVIGDLKVDAVFLIETIEHLDHEAKKTVFEIIKSVLRPGGFVFVTCPNSEDLIANTVCCPNCRTEFHRMQHVSAYSEAKLIDELVGLGVGEVITGTTNFRYRLTQQKLKGLLARFTGRKLPHLYACGTMNK